MNKKNKYRIQRWFNFTINWRKQYQIGNIIVNKEKDDFTIESVAEMIWWKRILKNELKNGIIKKFEITKIE